MSTSRTRKYKYSLKPSDLGQSEALKELVNASFCASGRGDKVKGLREIKGENIDTGMKSDNGARKLKLNGKPVPEDLTEEMLAEMFHGQHESLLKHFSQRPAQYTSGCVVGIPTTFPDGSLTKAALKQQERSSVSYQDPRTDLEPDIDIYYDETDDVVYFETKVLIQLALFSFEHDPSENKATEMHSRFKLLKPEEETPDKKGFELVSISTNDKIARDLFKGQSFWQRLFDKWRALSTTRKIAASVVALAGVAAIVLGVFFPPSLVVTLPTIGKITSASLLVFGGAGLAGASVLGHATDIILPRQHFKQRWHAMSKGPKITAGFAALLGVGAIIGGVVLGILCPPTLVVTLPLVKWTVGAAFLAVCGGVGLTGVTLLGHAIHVRATSLPVRSEQTDPPAAPSSASHLGDNRYIDGQLKKTKPTTRTSKTSRSDDSQINRSVISRSDSLSSLHNSFIRTLDEDEEPAPTTPTESRAVTVGSRKQSF